MGRRVRFGTVVPASPPSGHTPGQPWQADEIGWRRRLELPIMIGMDDRSRFLAAYDEQLRTDAETPSAASVTALGPLRLVTFAGGRGFITYQDLGGADADTIRNLV